MVGMSFSSRSLTKDLPRENYRHQDPSMQRFL